MYTATYAVFLGCPNHSKPLISGVRRSRVSYGVYTECGGGGGGGCKNKFIVLASEPVGGISRATELSCLSLAHVQKYFVYL